MICNVRRQLLLTLPLLRLCVLAAEVKHRLRWAYRAICNKADGWAPWSLYIDQVSVTARYCEVECWRVGLRPNVSVFQCLLKRLLWVWLQ
jgi:hypothetical protein